jgi:hypothetical protein
VARLVRRGRRAFLRARGPAGDVEHIVLLDPDPGQGALFLVRCMLDSHMTYEPEKLNRFNIAVRQYPRAGDESDSSIFFTTDMLIAISR